MILIAQLTVALPCSQHGHLSAILERVADIQFKMRVCLHKNSLNIKYLVFVAYSTEFKLERICKSLYFVFIYILQNVPTSLELGFVHMKLTNKDTTLLFKLFYMCASKTSSV